MAITYVETLSIPGPERITNWLFSGNILAGSSVVLRPRGGTVPDQGIVGYASLVVQIDGANMFLPSQPLQVFPATASLLYYPFVAADPVNFAAYPNYVAVWLFDYIQGGFIDVGYQDALVYLARF